MVVLKGFQREGVNWLKERERNGIGGFLCDEMGLGKTVMLLSLCMERPVERTLVVVPKSIVGQWVSETKKFTQFKVGAFNGPDRVIDENDQLVVCPYSVLGDLVMDDWDRIILDEAHEIRNPRSKIFEICQKLRGKKKWIVTGTPIFNNIRDLVALASFLAIPQKNIQKFSEDFIKKFILRRTRNDIEPFEIRNISLTMSPAEKALYDIAYSEFLDVLVDGSEFGILEGLLRCRQLSVLPQLYYDGLAKKNDTVPEIWEGSTVKMDKLLEMVKEHPTEKSIIFTHFTGETDFIQSMFTQNNIWAFKLDGSTTDREQVIRAFKKSPENSVFVIQIKSGGVGLNLQEASRIYITHPAWNAATEQQAIARAHRSGQKKKVIVTKLVYVSDTSVEQEIIELQYRKARMTATALDEPVANIPLCNEIKHTFAIKLGLKLNVADI